MAQGKQSRKEVRSWWQRVISSISANISELIALIIIVAAAVLIIHFCR